MLLSLGILAQNSNIPMRIEIQVVRLHVQFTKYVTSLIIQCMDIRCGPHFLQENVVRNNKKGTITQFKHFFISVQ